MVDAHTFNNALIQATPADMCAPLTLDHGKASSDSPSKAMETVDITCDDGYEKVGTSATCSPNDSGKLEWKDIPTCEGRSEG